MLFHWGAEIGTNLLKPAHVGLHLSVFLGSHFTGREYPCRFEQNLLKVPEFLRHREAMVHKPIERQLDLPEEREMCCLHSGIRLGAHGVGFFPSPSTWRATDFSSSETFWSVLLRA